MRNQLILDEGQEGNSDGVSAFRSALQLANRHVVHEVIWRESLGIEDSTLNPRFVSFDDMQLNFMGYRIASLLEKDDADLEEVMASI